MFSINFTPDQFLAEIDKQLSKGVNDLKHPFHQFSFATFNKGGVSQRMVVLRRWILARRTIMFHTDKRSPKIQELKKNRTSSILFYSSNHNLQLRFSCETHVHEKSKLAEVMFNQSSPRQRTYYQYNLSPSMKMDKNLKRKHLMLGIIFVFAYVILIS